MLDLDSAAEQLVTLGDCIRWGASRFNEAGLAFGHGTDNAFDEAYALALHAVHLPYDMPERYLDARLTLDERRAVLALMQRRVDERRPAAYITGEAWFAGLPFRVDERVLVPRSPLAEAIEAGFAPWLDPEAVTAVLDIGTGSGCIAVACAYAFPGARVDATDVSDDALEVARANVARHDLTDRVEPIRSDVYEQLGERRYDLIVSNPPYVTAEVMAALPQEYRHEPAAGLAGGDDGLAVARRILDGASEHLRPGGVLVVEAGDAAERLARERSELPFTRLSFERGGHGVLLLPAEALGVAAHTA